MIAEKEVEGVLWSCLFVYYTQRPPAPEASRYEDELGRFPAHCLAL